MMKRVRRIVSRVGAWLDDLLFPEDVLCLCCDRALGREDEDGVCHSCRMALDRLARRQQAREEQEKGACPDGLTYIRSAYVYEGPARQLIRRLKYESVRLAAESLAKQMICLPVGDAQIIVPVPTDKRRERVRGFNQSALLAEHVGKALGMPVVPALRRIEHRPPQTGLPAKERYKNLVGCMTADERVRGRRVLLIDDVYTTGSTVSEAARALYEAGAGSIGVITAARASGEKDEALDPFVPAKRA